MAAIDLTRLPRADRVSRAQEAGCANRAHRRYSALRDAVQIKFTEDALGCLDGLVPAAVDLRHLLDALTVHTTVVQRTAACITTASGRPFSDRARSCERARAPAAQVRSCSRAPARFVIGRGVIQPWLFNQIRQQLRGERVSRPTGRDVAAYIRALWETQASFAAVEKTHCDRMKKFLNYLGEGVPGPFLKQIRQSQTAAEFHRICDEFLDHDEPMALLPLELTAELAPA